MSVKLTDVIREARIDNLIPEAVRVANRSIPPDYMEVPPGKWPDVAKNTWNAAYHTSMDEQAKGAGLRV